MAMGEVLVIVILCVYTKYIFGLITKKKRDEIINKNKQLNDYRKIPAKTLEQQKEFLNIKYPKKKFKFEWVMIPKFVFWIGIYMLIYRSWSFLLHLIGWEPKLWQGIMFLFLTPIIFNYILKKFNLQKSDSTMWG